MSVAQLKCMSVQCVQLLLTDTPVSWGCVGSLECDIPFWALCSKKSQSTVTIIRDPEGLIYKECLNQVESLAKCVRKDKNS